MKKILYIIGVLLALASCTEDELTVQEQDVTGQTFRVAIEEPDYAPQTRTTVAMNRYLLEMYEGNLSDTPEKQSNTTGSFDVTLNKGTDYICLFWADNGTDAYNADNLKAVKPKGETQPGTPAYFAKVTVNSKTFKEAITLKRAIAELSFIDKDGLTGSDNSLTITYPYASATMNVGAGGTVTYATGGTVKRTLTGISTSTANAVFATDLILAPATAGKLTGLKLQLNDGEEKTIEETAVQANYRTKITGRYQQP